MKYKVQTLQFQGLSVLMPMGPLIRTVAMMMFLSKAAKMGLLMQ